MAVGSAAPKISLSPATLDFGSVNAGTTKDSILTVGNTGNAPLTVSTISSSNANFTVTAPALPFNVPAGAQQAVTIRFSAAAGAQSGTLSVATKTRPAPRQPHPSPGPARRESCSAPKATAATSADSGRATWWSRR